MIVAILLVLSSLLAAGVVVNRFAGLEKRSFKLGAGLLVAAMFCGWASFLASLFLGGLTPFSVLIAAVFVAAFAVLFCVFARVDVKACFTGLGKLPSKPLLAFFLVLLAFFSYLFVTRMLAPGAEGLYSGGSSWGDLAIHSTLINSFVFGSNSHASIWNLQGLQFPVFPPAQLAYPFLMDFQASALISGGLSEQAALCFPGIALAMAFVLLLYSFFSQFAGGQKTAVVAIMLVLLGGGLGFAYFLQDARALNLSPLEHLTSLRLDYTHYSDQGIVWSNIIGDTLLPQRGQLVGLPAAVLVFCLLWINFDETDKQKRKNRFALAGIVMGLLPFFHAHAFLGSLFISGCILLLSNLPKKTANGVTPALKEFFENLRSVIGEWSLLFAPALLLALPQLLWLAPQVSKGFITLALGWYAKSLGVDWLAYWVKALGIVFLLALPALLLSSAKHRKFYLPFLAIFAAANVFSFQPFLYDNMKLFYLWFIPTCGLVAALLAKAWNSKFLLFNSEPRMFGNIFSAVLIKLNRKNVLMRLAVIIVFVAAVLSGALSLVKETNAHWLLYSWNDVSLAQYTIDNTPPDSLFLASDRHNHWVTGLAGRNTVMGYRGWLWTYGFYYADREKDVVEMFAGGPGAKQLFNSYGVDYVVLGETEKKEWRANQTFFSENFKVRFSNAAGQILSPAWK